MYIHHAGRIGHGQNLRSMESAHTQNGENGNQDQHLGFFKSNFHFPGVLLTKVKGWCLVYIMYNILYPPNNIDYFGSREGSSIYVVLY